MSKKLNQVLALMLTIAALLTGQTAWADTTWSVENNTGSTFRIKRSTSGTTETVKYRTVNLSAYAGQHYTAKSGEVTFGPTDTYIDVTVTERTPAADAYAYKYQTGTKRKYRFDVTDLGGFYLAHCDREITTGTRFSADKVSKSITNLVYFSGTNYASGLSSSKYLDVSYTPPSNQVETSGTLKDYVLIDDSYDYAQKAATVSTSTLINSTGADATYLNSIRYKIYATVCFTEKEKDDGYQYIQIIAGNGSASYDTGYDPEKSVNNPSNSVYKACFELSDNSNAEGKQYFPHRYSYANKTAETNANIGITEFTQTNGKFWQQKFKSGYQATNSGSLIFDVNTSYITTRFDAGGDNDDTWGYKDFFVRMALVDATAPTVSTVSVAPGRYSKGNTVYVSVAFDEIVTSSSARLTSNWGDLSYVEGSGSNVLTFSREIPTSASSALNITGFSGITDLAGNAPGSITSSNLCSLDDNYTYTITYNLNDGSVATANPTTYTWETAAITLNNPTKTGYVFNGWTGSNGNTPSTTVTITNHSHGNKSYTANWTQVWTGSGTAGDPYIITSPLGLDYLAQYVNSGNTCKDLYFQLGGNLEYAYAKAWNVASEENNYTTIGTEGHSFQGTFDGNNYTISGIRIYKGGGDFEDKYQGLFGRVNNGGTVKRVNLANTRITGYMSTGGIVGELSGTVEDCTVGADVCIHTVAENNNYIGGIVGELSGTVQRCISHVTLTVADNLNDIYVYGGIVGYSSGTVNNCIAEGAVIPGVTRHGAIAGDKLNGSSSLNNYYRACTVAGIENATGVGCKGTDINGARALYAVTLPANASLTRSASATLPGSGNKTYANGADIAGIPYAVASSNLLLSYNSASIPSDYVLSSISAKETSGGAAVAITDNGDYSYDFTMPAADVTVTATLLPIVSYIDTDGVEQSHVCTPIADSNFYQSLGTAGETNWYVVSGNVSTKKLNFKDATTNIILCDNATLTISVTSLEAINNDNGSINIFAQSCGTGAINVTNCNYGIYAYYDVNINGGAITISNASQMGIWAGNGNLTIRRSYVDVHGNSNGLGAMNNVNILSGVVNATCGTGYGIKSNYNDIILGCPTAEDRICASSYYVNHDAKHKIKVADGQTLTDGYSDHSYSGTLSNEQIAAIAGKTMMKPLGDVSYIDENGQAQTCTEYTILSDGTIPIDSNDWGTIGTDDQDTWYVATGNYTFNHKELDSNGHVHLILCDDATFTVNGNFYGIQAKSLTIYGQSEGTGSLVASTTAANGGQGAIKFSGALTINGGNVSTSSVSGNSIRGDLGTILTINGGNVNVTGAADGIYCIGDITLGWAKLTDHIYASSYNYEGTVSIKDGQTFWNGSEGLSGTITDMAKLDDKTLRPCFSITLPDGITASGVLGQDGTTAYALPEATVTLSSEEGYHLADVTVNGNAATDNGDETWSFQMPATNITVTATIISGGYCGFASVNSGQNVIWAYNLSTTTLTISPNPEAIASEQTNFNMAGYDESNQPWNDYKGALTTVVIDAGVTSIGSNAFYECSKLESITIPASVTTIDYCAFEYCYELEDVTFAAGSLLTSIGSSAFSSCGKLSAITIPASVENIDEYVFQECYNLEDVTFAASSQLTSIGASAFYNCSNLSAITIPEHVTAIGGNAFAECPSLSTIIALPATPPSLGSPMGGGGDRNSDNIYFRNQSYWGEEGWRGCVTDNCYNSFDHGYLLMDKEANDIAALYTALHDDDRYAVLHNDDPEDDDLPYEGAPIDSIVNVMLYGRTLYKDGGWNTLCLPFNVEVGSGLLEDATAMVLDGSTSNFETSTGVLTLNFTGVTSGNTITAGTPFIVKWESGEDLVNPDFRHVSFSNSTNDVTSADGRVQFKGTYSPIDYASDNQSILFLGTGNKLYYPQAGANIGSCRAYFQLNGSNEVKEFKLNFNEEDEQPLSISPEGERLGSFPREGLDGVIYNLSGQKLNKMQKGINIVNGKKMFVK